jgi:YesN/AraC family two-component response regulator
VEGEAATGREAVELVRRLSPDVVVMDLRMPDLNGIDAARQIIAIKPGIKSNWAIGSG